MQKLGIGTQALIFELQTLLTIEPFPEPTPPPTSGPIASAGIIIGLEQPSPQWETRNLKYKWV